ncbi:MAG: hypothetical protein E5Y02_00695 [Mesorhizobium sp.]|nr:MAG: hypothetical protein E5Y02_00695 [Mesorhizobium sp.]
MVIDVVSRDDWIDPLLGGGRTFRRALGAFTTGVTVVAINSTDGSPRAFTANSFTSVSLTPPLVLVCLAKSLVSIRLYESAETFSINVLARTQREESNAFASRDPDVKAAAMTKLAADVAPTLPGSLATFVCAREQLIDAGDHTILIGRVLKLKTLEGEPLGFFRGAYVGIGSDVREIEKTSAKLTVGGVLGKDGEVLLCRYPGSHSWEIPSVTLAHGERHGTALRKRFEQLGVKIQTAIPYSLFQEPGEDGTTLVFAVDTAEKFETRTAVNGVETRLFSRASKPWTLIRGVMKQGLLERYLEETQIGLLGVYFDTIDGGSVLQVEGRPLDWEVWMKAKVRKE